MAAWEHQSGSRPPSILTSPLYKASDCSQLQCSTIHSRQRPESPECPSIGDEGNVAWTYKGAILHHTAEILVIQDRMDGAGGHSVKQTSQAKKRSMFSLISRSWEQISRRPRVGGQQGPAEPTHKQDGQSLIMGKTHSLMGAQDLLLINQQGDGSGSSTVCFKTARKEYLKVGNL